MSEIHGDGTRARIRRLLTEYEGVSPADAEDFLSVLDASGEEDVGFHAGMVAELERRLAMRETQADIHRATAARDLLSSVSRARDTRVGPGDVRGLVGVVKRGLA